VIPLPTTPERSTTTAADDPHDVARVRLARLARLLRATGRPCEAIAVQHIADLLVPGVHPEPGPAGAILPRLTLVQR